MTPTLYHANMSVCSAKVRMALAEKGQGFESHTLDLRAGDQQKPEYLKLNPNAVVPTLVHDGSVIIESGVINEYIAEVFPGTPLVTSDPVSRTRMRVWTKQLDEGVHQFTTVVTFAIAFRHQMLAQPQEVVKQALDGIPDPERRTRQWSVFEQGVDSPHFVPAVRRFDKLCRDMEASLAAGPWLAGKDYSLADIAYAPYITRLDHLGMGQLWERRPGLAAWYDRVRARPAYAESHTRWDVKPVVELMRAKGAEATAKVRAILAA